MAFEVHKFDSGEFLHVVLLDDVENFEDLNDVVSCNLNVVLFNPELIINIFQVYVAVLKALTNKSNNKMITKSFQSEVLFSVSPSKNIATSIKRFSAKENSKSVLVVAVHTTDETSYLQNLLKNIKCTFRPTSDLHAISNLQDIKMVYGITEKELSCSTLVDSVVTRISTKDFL